MAQKNQVPSKMKKNGKNKAARLADKSLKCKLCKPWKPLRPTPDALLSHAKIHKDLKYKICDKGCLYPIYKISEGHDCVKDEGSASTSTSSVPSKA